MTDTDTDTDTMFDWIAQSRNLSTQIIADVGAIVMLHDIADEDAADRITLILRNIERLKTRLDKTRTELLEPK
jgi:hypothetical protein